MIEGGNTTKLYWDILGGRLKEQVPKTAIQDARIRNIRFGIVLWAPSAVPSDPSEGNNP
jgi:hypothetical protein